MVFHKTNKKSGSHKILLQICILIKFNNIYKWKYSDTLCSGYKFNEESGEEILRCENLGKDVQKIEYKWFYSSLVSEQISAGKHMMKELKEKDKIVEEIT